MWPRFGIKIGNSTLCIAYVKEDSDPVVIANKLGDRTSHACLLWDGVSEIECGATAKQKMATRPKQGVANSLQLLLKPDELNEKNVADAVQNIPCEYDPGTHVFRLKHTVQSEKDDTTKEVTHELSAFDVHVKLFRAELELALQHHKDPAQKPIVVLSIPSCFPETSRSLLAQAAEKAGFHVAQVISESTAAVLGYSVGEGDLGSKEINYVLSIKSGGLYSHFALYAVQDGFYTELDSFGPFPIGGRHYTEALEEFICEEFKRKYKLDPHESRRSIAKIRNAANNCKHILTTLSSTLLYIDSLMDGVDYNMQMSRARFDNLIQPVINKFMQVLNQSVDQALERHPEIDQINEIVLLGATIQIPKLQSAIRARFPDAELYTSIGGDEVVAVGCARQASFLQNPNAQELAVAEPLICAEEEQLIWHGDDEQGAQVLLCKGTLLPVTVQLEVKACKKTENIEEFKLRIGEKISKLYLKGAVPTEDGSFRLEAEFKCEQQEQNVQPVLILRSI